MEKPLRRLRKGEGAKERWRESTGGQSRRRMSRETGSCTVLMRVSYTHTRRPKHSQGLPSRGHTCAPVDSADTLSGPSAFTIMWWCCSQDGRQAGPRHPPIHFSRRLKVSSRRLQTPIRRVPCSQPFHPVHPTAASTGTYPLSAPPPCIPPAQPRAPADACELAGA